MKEEMCLTCDHCGSAYAAPEPVVTQPVIHRLESPDRAFQLMRELYADRRDWRIVLLLGDIRMYAGMGGVWATDPGVVKFRAVAAIQHALAVAAKPDGRIPLGVLEIESVVETD